MKIQVKKYRLMIVMVLIVIVPLGLYTKLYAGPGQSWAANSLGGFIYEIFWCLVAAFVFTAKSPSRIATWVFLATCSLEVLQLWHPPFLEYLRSGFLGRTLLGSTFNWTDFPYYAAGSLAGWYLLKVISGIASVNQHTSDQPSR